MKKARMNGTAVETPLKHRDRDVVDPGPPDAGGPERSGASEPPRSGGAPTSRPEPQAAEGPVPDPEFVPRASRRRYDAAFKARVLREADACKKPGEIGALLRREGIYSSLLSVWRRERERRDLDAFQPKKRGRKPTDPRDVENERLRRENERLQERLRIAELICQAQKKVAQILGITLAKPENDGKPS